MKKSILMLLCFIVLLFPVKGNASTISEQREALMQTAWAYYNQNVQLQYDTYR